MKRVFVTRQIPDEGLKMLRAKRYKVDVYEKDHPIPRKELIRRLKKTKYDAILSILTEKIDAAVLNAAGPQLKIVANYAVGFNNIDIDAAEARKVVVTNTPDPAVNESVAEHVMALMFALAHRIVESDDFARANKYKAWSPTAFMGTDLHSKTLGIVGLGNIGTEVAHRMHDGFNMKILYNNLSRNPEAEKKYGARRVSLNELLKRSDFVTLHVPLLPSTRHLIGRKELKMMKKTAYLINTARGPVVDEKALISMLQKKEIAGAGVDVYEFEPRIPAAMRKLPNVITTPHTASATIETRQAMSRRAAQNIIAVLSGKTPPNQVK